MNKTEYVKTIEKALVGKVSPQELQDIVGYYRDYIDMEIRKGSTEQEVLEHLGDPRLLAKSIISAQGQQEKYNETKSVQEETTQGRSFRIPLLVIVVIILFVLGLALSFVFALARFMIPILIPVALVMGIMSLIKHFKN